MYRDKFFKQVDGVATGSPLGPILANFFLGHIEETSLFQDNSDCPKLYIRYVDDILAVFPEGTTYHPFFQRLNKQQNAARFIFTSRSRSRSRVVPNLDNEARSRL